MKHPSSINAEKPRDWHVRLAALVVNDNTPGTFDDQIHVIEYSAYEQVVKERDAMKEILSGVTPHQQHKENHCKMCNGYRKLNSILRE